ncbi:MAG: hypothetical protein ACOCV2_03200 [Persicimonas sp.]
MTRPSIYLLFCLVACAAIASATPAYAQQSEAPNAHFLFGSDIFESGQSNNLGPAAQIVLEEGMYWFEGDCPDESGSRYDCDLLRFGAAVYPRECSQASPARIATAVKAREDGGSAVQDALQQMQNGGHTSYCDSEPAYRPLDEALVDHQTELFDGTESSDDSPWERPNLNLLIVSDIPQTSDANDPDNHADDARAKGAIERTCQLLLGESDETGARLPATPTWVMMARRHESSATTYGGLLAAAGATGQCCHDPSGACAPTDPAEQIDVCDAVDDFSEVELREAIADGEFRCDEGTSDHQTGSLDFGERDRGTLPHILCHFAGDDGHANCSASSSGDAYRRPTDVLEKMSCVRKVPSNYEGGPLEICDRHDECERVEVCDHDESRDECGATFVDPNHTLVAVSGEDDAGASLCYRLGGGGYVQPPSCPDEGEACTVEERDDGVEPVGRCAVGEIRCNERGEERCEALYDPMPEICNGRDDDCDGDIDNLSTSWDAFDGEYEPTDLEGYDSDGVDRSGVHCYERDACRCTNGPLDHGGPGFDAHVMSWEPGSCECGETLGEDDPATSGTPTEDTRATQPRASCSSGGQGPPSLLLGLIAVGLWAMSRRFGSGLQRLFDQIASSR